MVYNFLNDIYKDVLLWDFLEKTKTRIYFSKKSNTSFSMTLKRKKKQITFKYTCTQELQDYPEVTKLFRQFMILFPISYEIFVDAYDISDKKIYESALKDYNKLSKIYTDDELSILLYI